MLKQEWRAFQSTLASQGEKLVADRAKGIIQETMEEGGGSGKVEDIANGLSNDVK